MCAGIRGARFGLAACVLGSEIYAGDWGLVNWDPRYTLGAGGVCAGIRGARSGLGAPCCGLVWWDPKCTLLAGGS